MINWNKETKKRIQAVLGTAKTSFYYGFIPLIIYLGIAKYSVFILAMIVELFDHVYDVYVYKTTSLHLTGHIDKYH